jgi:hypothetical protein
VPPLIREPRTALYLPASAFDWALDHAEQFGDTVFLPDAFEYEAIRYSWDTVRDWLTEQNMVRWNPRSGRRLLAPKSRYSFRYVTQLDPLEYLAFTALLHEVGPQLEQVRVPVADERVLSWRFALGPNGQMYDPAYDWLQFTQRSERLARESGTEWVVVADIADFFPRVYIHPVERILAQATGASPHAYCLLRHIRNWNTLVSYGLPVGVSGSRIIAEATIDDIDRGLIGAGRRYCRYADDIRIFCTSETEARGALEQLARMLFENHGHTLAPAKTDILPAADYLGRFDVSGERLEAESLTERFHELIEAAGLDDDYHADLDYDELPEDVQEKIDEMNLVAVFNEQIEAERSDPVVMKIILHRLGQLNIDDVVDDVLANLDTLNHVMDSVVQYFSALRNLPERKRHSIGQRVLASLDSTPIGAYERICLLNLFTRGREYDQENQFEALLSRYPDRATQRELILALGRAGQQHWFLTNRRDLGEMDAWSKRAFLAGFSCVALDAREAFYKSLRGGGDVLEAAVIRWAEAHPFR